MAALGNLGSRKRVRRFMNCCKTLMMVTMGVAAGNVASGLLPVEAPVWAVVAFLVTGMVAVLACDVIELRCKDRFARAYADGYLTAKGRASA
jgi:hypothetical protein